jgi:hypothetical protein
MKLTRILPALVATVVMATAMAASAATLTSANLLGTIVPGTPSDPANEATMINFLVNAYNSNPAARVLGDNIDDPQTEVYTLTSGSSVPAGPLAQATMTGSVEVITSNQTINLGAGGYMYVVAKYGNDSEVFYIGGMTGEITLANFTGNQNGLSHYVLFNPAGTPSVPDGGTTMALMGLGFCALGVARRRLKL